MSDLSTEVISMRLPSRLELLSVLDRVADSVCERLDFDEDARGQITMSVIEAGTNAIQHGHRKDASKPLDVEFRVHPTVLEIAVHDSGTGFNPDDVNGDVTGPAHLLDQRGRGLFIMRSCMDRVEYTFDRHGTLLPFVQEPPAQGRQPPDGGARAYPGSGLGRAPRGARAQRRRMIATGLPTPSTFAARRTRSFV